MSNSNPKTNILLADDHQLVMDGIKSMLAIKKEYIIKSEVQNGANAIKAIKAAPNDFDLVITDISMPIIGGIELCTVIKQQFPHIKVIILSMHNDIVTIKKAIEAEADGYLLKNITHTDFLNGIERVLDNGTFFSQDILPLVLNQIKTKHDATLKPDLTKREQEILELIMQEFTSKEIAEKLFISYRTIDTHRMNIMEKTKCKTLVGLIKFAIEMQ